MKSLLIGCGAARDRRVLQPFGPNAWSNLTTLDHNPDYNPDVVHDLESLPLPFAANSFDEIHAYEVLEHTGRQGDWRFFLDQFSDFWRILQPGGFLCGTCPTGVWVWGDPSHSRAIQPESFVFLDQTEYARQAGKTSMSDFRSVYKADFQAIAIELNRLNFAFVLKAHKPPRV